VDFNRKENHMRRPRFAEVTSVLALFIALGGTGYAATQLPGNSVGAAQIRTGAVGKSEARTGAIGKAEIRTGAVGKAEIATDAVGASDVRKDAIGTSELRDSAIEIGDLSAAAKTALAADSAVTFRAAVTSSGAAAGGNAKGATRSATGEYVVDLGRDVSACQLAATMAGVRNGTSTEAAIPGLITATADAGANTVHVSTKTAAGVALDAPFHLLVAC
jgi:hypothetical protein